MDLFHYPYRFVQKVEDSPYRDSFLKYKLLYTFKSSRSHQWYWVWVEVYEYDLYAVKFHLKAHRDSKNKYNLMTGLNEARPVIHTCIAIMQEIADVNPHASFGFIGANMDEESVFQTKRFRIYSRMMVSYFKGGTFEHYMIVAKSAYLMIRKSELEKEPHLAEIFSDKFKELYDYFD